jgi:hypothetical protein
LETPLLAERLAPTEGFRKEVISLQRGTIVYRTIRIRLPTFAHPRFASLPRRRVRHNAARAEAAAAAAVPTRGDGKEAGLGARGCGARGDGGAGGTGLKLLSN